MRTRGGTEEYEPAIDRLAYDRCGLNLGESAAVESALDRRGQEGIACSRQATNSRTCWPG